MGIGTMARKEKATIFVSSTYLTKSSLMPQLEGLEEVHFDVELIQFIQVLSLLFVVSFCYPYFCYAHAPHDCPRLFLQRID